MANDNNLLLIILIGIVMFWIFNINTTERFDNVNSIRKKSKKNSIEHFRENLSVKSELSRSESPTLNDRQVIEEIYREKMSTANAPRSVESPAKYSNNRERNPTQKTLQTPPTIRNTSNVNKMAQEMATQIVPNSRQPMTPGDNPMGNTNDRQNTLSTLDQSYLLLPRGSMPDPKFNKVMPSETRKNLQSGDLLPVDENDSWFQVPNSKFNLMQAVDLELAETKIGTDTVGQSRKNATYDLRAAPPCPKFVVSPWQNSTIEPDYNTKPLC
jgi:hypothetical protein